MQLTYWSHQSPDKWVTLIEDTISLEPLKKVGEDLCVSHPTAQNMRHKLLVFLNESMENMPVLDEIIETDETFFLESSAPSGQKSNSFLGWISAWLRYRP